MSKARVFSKQHLLAGDNKEIQALERRLQRQYSLGRLGATTYEQATSLLRQLSEVLDAQPSVCDTQPSVCEEGDDK